MLLDHVNLRCANPETMVAFLERIGCAHMGERPAFDGPPGYWLYDDSDRPVVHVSTRSDSAAMTAGVVDHVAFLVNESLTALRARLQAAEVTWTEYEIPLTGIVQVVIVAPEGLLLELQVPDSLTR